VPTTSSGSSLPARTATAASSNASGFSHRMINGDAEMIDSCSLSLSLSLLENAATQDDYREDSIQTRSAGGYPGCTYD
jgi:hypothetical protein